MPHKAHEMQPTATSLYVCPESIPFITSNDLKNLKVELPAYLAYAAGTSAEFSPLEWWKNNLLTCHSDQRLLEGFCSCKMIVRRGEVKVLGDGYQAESISSYYQGVGLLPK